MKLPNRSRKSMPFFLVPHPFTRFFGPPLTEIFLLDAHGLGQPMLLPELWIWLHSAVLHAHFECWNHWLLQGNWLLLPQFPSASGLLAVPSRNHLFPLKFFLIFKNQNPIVMLGRAIFHHTSSASIGQLLLFCCHLLFLLLIGKNLVNCLVNASAKASQTEMLLETCALQSFIIQKFSFIFFQTCPA